MPSGNSIAQKTYDKNFMPWSNHEKSRENWNTFLKKSNDLRGNFS